MEVALIADAVVMILLLVLLVWITLDISDYMNKMEGDV